MGKGLNIHVYSSTFEHDTRIMKETLSIANLDLFEKILMVGQRKKAVPRKRSLDLHREVHCISTLTCSLTGTLGKVINHLEWQFLVLIKILFLKQVQSIHAHSLTVLFLTVVLKHVKKATLIYDAHELETETVNNFGIRKRFSKWMERKLIRKADFVVVVSDSIANWYRNTYQLSNVSVARNIPFFNEASKQAVDVKHMLGIPKETILFLYQGMLNQGRGIVEILNIFVQVDKNKHILFLGNGSFSEEIKKYQSQYENIHYLPAVPLDVLMQYTRGADIGIHLIEANCLNHQYCLPNKIFEYLHAGIAIFVRDIPEIANVLKKHDCGWLAPTESQDTVAFINQLTTQEIESKQKNVQQCRGVYSWQFEEKVFQNLFLEKSVVQNRETYRICSRCIMDNANDPYIYFDEQGICNYCHEYKEKAALLGCITENENLEKFSDAIRQLKELGKNKPYDCVIGLSGGADSSYVAYLLKQQGIRPLAVHLDNGWNSELAVKNIELIVNKLDIPLITYVIDWEEFKDIQSAFLKASLANLEAVTDHAIPAILFKTAKKYGIKYIVNGGNIATESILPKHWGSDGRDLKHIKAVHKKFGNRKMKTYPTMTLWDMFSYLFIRRIKLIFLLNYIHYNKEAAIRVLEHDLGWKPYGGKHYESIITRFFQGYLLPVKFNLDKRRSHLSTLINSYQMTRENALKEMMSPPYPSEQMLEEDKTYVVKKFGLTEEEFLCIMNEKAKNYTDYPQNAWLYRSPQIIRLIKKFLTKF